MSSGVGDRLRVAIIGGGPAGTATAIRLKRKGREKGVELDVILFEGKDFELHYNQCVGVLSPPIERILLNELQIDLPIGIFKRQIKGYRLHAGGREVLLVGEQKLGPTFAVRRVKFDAYMLDEARKAGVEVIRTRVTDLDFVNSAGRVEVVVFSEAGTRVVDFVVGAFGLDEGTTSIFERSTRRYKRPSRYTTTYITKLHVEEGFIERKLGDIIYAFLYPRTGGRIEFGAITPKGDHIIINAAGRNISLGEFLRFLKIPEVRDHLPEFTPDLSQIFKGKFPSSPASGVTGPSYAIVGDATGFLRPLKGKGITTGVMTGIFCADTILEHFVEKVPMTKYEKLCRELVSDYAYGSFIKIITKGADRLGLLGSIVETSKVNREVYEGLFNAVSGHDSFKNIVLSNFNLKTIMSAVKLNMRNR